nr:hemerythrin family protein [uncultured Lachnoclostridium sp.]
MSNWKSFYELEIPVVDKQHQELFDILFSMRYLLNKEPAESRKKDIESIFLIFKKHIFIHFSIEENIMDSMVYPETSNHRLEHTRFLEILNALKDDTITSEMDTLEFLEEWIYEHVSSYDWRLAKYYHSQHSKP